MGNLSLFASIRESVKESMAECPLDRMDAPPTFKNMETLVEQFDICVAGVRISPQEGVWDDRKYGCLPLALDNHDLEAATNCKIEDNSRLPRPGDIHVDIEDDTTPK